MSSLPEILLRYSHASDRALAYLGACTHARYLPPKPYFFFFINEWNVFYLVIWQHRRLCRSPEHDSTHMAKASRPTTRRAAVGHGYSCADGCLQAALHRERSGGRGLGIGRSRTHTHKVFGGFCPLIPCKNWKWQTRKVLAITNLSVYRFFCSCFFFLWFYVWF